MRTILYLTLAIALFSCRPEPEVLAPIMGAPNAQFRGNSIGDSYTKVQTNVATDNPVSLEADVLTCEFKIEHTDLSVRYEFEHEKLYTIQADIFFSDTTELGTFERALEDHYNSIYGHIDERAGFLVWHYRNNETEVEFALADESVEFGRPKLSLTIYNLN